MNVLFKKCAFLTIGFISMMIYPSCSERAEINQKYQSAKNETIDYHKIDDLMSLAGGHTYSSITPMGIFFEKLCATNEQIEKWLIDPNEEPSLPIGKETNLELKEFPVELYPFDNPSQADCNQRELGNCSAIAVFAELAYINPDFVKSIIKDNGNKTYTIQMYDPQGKAIAVTVSNKFMSNKSDGKLAGVNGKNGQATWATVMEKALMKYIDAYQLAHSIEGIGSEYASPPFTGDGDSFSFHPGALTGEELKRVVDVSLEKGKIVIGGFNKENVKVGNSNTAAAHAWSFSYAPDSNRNGYAPLFVMRNPWGYDNGPDRDGQMYIPAQADVTAMIDLRIINAGKAKPSKKPSVYAAPVY